MKCSRLGLQGLRGKYWLDFRPENALQGYLAHKNNLPLGLTAGLSLGPYGGPRGGAVSYERGTPVAPFSWGGKRSVVKKGLQVGNAGKKGVHVRTIEHYTEKSSTHFHLL